jgi:hypothetical protein
MAFEVTLSEFDNKRIQAMINWKPAFHLHALYLWPVRQLQTKNQAGEWVGEGDWKEDASPLVIDDHDRIDPQTMQIYREHEWRALEGMPGEEPSAENQAILARLKTPMQWLEVVSGNQLGYTNCEWPLFGAIALFVEATAQTLLAKQ